MNSKKVITLDKQGSFDLKEVLQGTSFEEYMDMIKFYSLTMRKDKSLVLKLYDSKKKRIRPQELLDTK
jgi:hypothetical protein